MKVHMHFHLVSLNHGTLLTHRGVDLATKKKLQFEKHVHHCIVLQNDMVPVTYQHYLIL